MSLLSVDLSGLNGLLDDLGDRAELAARPASQAAAQVIYDEVKRNVAALGHKTGNLDRSIYQTYSQRRSGVGFATYQVSFNWKKARHAGLVEFGHIQRYVSYVGKDGQWHTARRKGMRDRRAPGKDASQAEKDAFYLPLASPRQVPATPFIRPAMNKEPQALAAAEEVLLRFINDY